jgi:hypothetical protein
VRVRVRVWYEVATGVNFRQSIHVLGRFCGGAVRGGMCGIRSRMRQTELTSAEYSLPGTDSGGACRGGRVDSLGVGGRPGNLQILGLLRESCSGTLGYARVRTGYGATFARLGQAWIN